MEDILVGEIERLKGEVARMEKDTALLRSALSLWRNYMLDEFEVSLQARTNLCKAERERDEAREWERRLYRALVEIRGLAKNEAYIYGYDVEAILESIQDTVNKALGGK